MKFDRYTVVISFMATTIIMFAAFIANMTIVVFIQNYLEWVLPIVLVVALMTFTYSLIVKDVDISKSFGNAKVYLTKRQLSFTFNLSPPLQ